MITVQKENLLETTVNALSSIELDFRNKSLMLDRVTFEADELRQALKESLAKSDTIQKQTSAAQVHLIRAERLIHMLHREERRWGHHLQQLQEQIAVLVGDVLLSSGIIVYLGGFQFEQRNSVLDEWVAVVNSRQIPLDKKFSISKFVIN